MSHNTLLGLPEFQGAVKPASALCYRTERATWTYDALVGRLVELSGADAPAVLTFAIALVRDAQERREPTGWTTSEMSTFFPPDVAEHGVDLSALVVARVQDKASVPRAAEILVRSGAFGLVVLDLGDEAEIASALLSRLAKVAQQRETVVLCLTAKPSGTTSLNSLISLHGEARRIDTATGLFRCELRILKDKRRTPIWVHWENHHGPQGLR